jgi:predicted nuclease with TOPRIM domain
MTDKQWEKKVEGIVFGGHVDTAPMDSEYVNRLQAEVERLTATCNYAVKELACVDCGSAPLEELARRAKAEVERLKAAFGPTIELMERLNCEPIQMDTVDKELARLRAIVEGGE